MPSKKKKYNARFPPARIKKIMQTDEDVGKVAAAVPVIISRALELFIESLICKSSEMTRSKNAKTLSTQHIKHTILAEKRFDFLKDLVANIPDVQHAEDEGETSTFTSPPEPKPKPPEGKKPRGRPKKKKPEDGEEPTPVKRRRRKKSKEQQLAVAEDEEETDSATEEEQDLSEKEEEDMEDEDEDDEEQDYHGNNGDSDLPGNKPQDPTDLPGTSSQPPGPPPACLETSRLQHRLPQSIADSKPHELEIQHQMKQEAKDSGTAVDPSLKIKTEPSGDAKPPGVLESKGSGIGHSISGMIAAKNEYSSSLKNEGENDKMHLGVPSSSGHPHGPPGFYPGMYPPPPQAGFYSRPPFMPPPLSYEDTKPKASNGPGPSAPREEPLDVSAKPEKPKGKKRGRKPKSQTNQSETVTTMAEQRGDDSAKAHLGVTASSAAGEPRGGYDMLPPRVPMTDAGHYPMHGPPFMPRGPLPPFHPAMMGFPPMGMPPHMAHHGPMHDSSTEGGQGGRPPMMLPFAQHMPPMMDPRYRGMPGMGAVPTTSSIPNRFPESQAPSHTQPFGSHQEAPSKESSINNIVTDLSKPKTLNECEMTHKS